MDMNDLFRAGSDIMDEVSRAVETGDYSRLTGSIQSRVNEVTEQVREQVKTAREEAREDTQAARAKNDRAQTADTKNYFLQRFPSKNKGLGRMVAGILLSVIFGLSSVSMLFTAISDLIHGWIYSFQTDVFGLLIAGLLTFAFALLAKSGKKKKELIKRYYRYGEVIGTGREYIGLQELEDKTGIPQTQIREDIETLRADSVLPYAVLDRSKTTLILSDRMYKEYTQSEKARQVREEEERIQRLREAAKNKGTGVTWEEASADVAAKEAKARAERAHEETEQLRADATGKAQSTSAGRKTAATQETGTGWKNGENAAGSPGSAAALVTEGQAYIKEIRAINDRIPDTEEMSDKLYHLEDIMKRIFEQAEKDPSKEKDLRKLMNYYLPTTMKLLNAYADLNEQPEAGDNIRDTKRQIEGSMDAINNAFEKLLDDLFQEQAWDLSSDLNVMKTMMAQDGLTE